MEAPKPTEAEAEEAAKAAEEEKKVPKYDGKKEKSWPPPSDTFDLSKYQPPSIPIDLETEIKLLADDYPDEGDEGDEEWELTCDPSAFIDYASDEQIHAACGLEGSPVAQGDSPAATAGSLRAWVRSQFLTVSPNCSFVEVGGEVSSAVFQRMSYLEWGALSSLNFPSLLPWVMAMQDKGLRLGSLFWVYRGEDNVTMQATRYSGTPFML